MPTLNPNQLCQVALVVHDIEKTARAFAALFGVPQPEIIVTGSLAEAHTAYKGQPSPARAKLAFIQLGAVALELIEPDAAPSTWREHLDAHGESVHHLAFTVQGMPEVVANLAQIHGLPLVQSGDYTGGRYAYIDSAPQLGVALELLEDL